MSLAYRFFVAGVLFALTGMSLGTFMGMTQDFTFAPVHAHINLVGWVTHFLFGLYYRAEPANALGLAAGDAFRLRHPGRHPAADRHCRRGHRQ